MASWRFCSASASVEPFSLACTKELAKTSPDIWVEMKPETNRFSFSAASSVMSGLGLIPPPPSVWPTSIRTPLSTKLLAVS